MVGHSEGVAGSSDRVSIERVRAGRDRLIAATTALSLRRPVEFEGLSIRAITERVGPSVELNSDLRTVWTIAAPVSVALPFSPERLTLYRPDDLAARQIGYRSGDWNPAWIVIGDSSADPVIADTSRPNTPILLAIHGTGAWRPSMVSPDPCTFMEAVAGWLDVLHLFDGSSLDAARDFQVKPGFYEALAETLSQTLPTDCVEAFVQYLRT